MYVDVHYVASADWGEWRIGDGKAGAGAINFGFQGWRDQETAYLPLPAAFADEIGSLVNVYLDGPLSAQVANVKLTPVYELFETVEGEIDENGQNTKARSCHFEHSTPMRVGNTGTSLRGELHSPLCVLRYGELSASIENEEMNEAVRGCMDEIWMDNAWIGIIKKAGSSKWKCLDGTNVEYSNWDASGGSTSDNSVDYCVYISRSTGKWTPMKCSEEPAMGGIFCKEGEADPKACLGECENGSGKWCHFKNVQNEEGFAEKCRALDWEPFQPTDFYQGRCEGCETSTTLTRPSYDPDNTTPNSKGNIVWMDDAYENEGAKCLDGSKPAFWWRQGFNDGDNHGTRKYHIYIQGGAWCSSVDTATSIETCQVRANTKKGSSNFNSDVKYLESRWFSVDSNTNPLLYNWNTAYVQYCDGASFGGNAEEPTNDGLWFRGERIRKGVIDELLNHFGMDEATDVLIFGTSAGGLAALWAADYIRERVLEVNTEAKIGVASESGIFIDSNVNNWREAQKWIFENQNTRDALNQNCVAHYSQESPGNEWKCHFPDYFAQFIETPIFAFQSLNDVYSLSQIVEENEQSVQEFHEKMLSLLLDEIVGDRPQNGAFIDCTYRHANNWNKVEIDGYYSGEALKEWWDNLDNFENGDLSVDSVWYDETCS